MAAIREFVLDRLADDQRVLDQAERLGSIEIPESYLQLWNGIGQHPVLSVRRLRAEIAVKREILGTHGLGSPGEFCGPCNDASGVTNACDILLTLAQVWSTHPSFKPAWAMPARAA